MLIWLLIALFSAIALSVAFGLFLAGVLGRISREVSEIVEDEEREMWATVPLARKSKEHRRASAAKRVRRRRDALAGY